ncbi:MAG: hypothetical protein Ct9H90mP7_2390 [Candidatus Neomarinimicrobiota bacterium]|nr:MAG: hypothetical protein Ct9H90mP7_2390 [Candidatus Neomarinimicrobiota bacterium]
MEMEYYPEICNIAHEIIKEGFSSNVITAGKQQPMMLFGGIEIALEN